MHDGVNGMCVEVVVHEGDVRFNERDGYTHLVWGTSFNTGTVANQSGWVLVGVLPWPYSLSHEPVKSPRWHQSKTVANCDQEMCVWLGPEVARRSKVCRIGASSGAHFGQTWRQVWHCARSSARYGCSVPVFLDVKEVG